MIKHLFSPIKNKTMELVYTIVSLLFAFYIIAVLMSSCTVVKTNFSSAAKKDATVYYYLPESLIKIVATTKVAEYYNVDDSLLNPKTRVIEQSFTTTSEMIADTKDLLSLNYTPNILMSDDIKYEVNAKGLLSNVAITTDDRTAEIVAKLAGAPQTIFGTEKGIVESEKTIVKIKEYTENFYIKASSLYGKSIKVDWQIIVENEVNKEEFITIPADFQISTPDIPTSISSISTIINGDDTSGTKEIDGILTRPLRNIQLNFEPSTDNFKRSSSCNITIVDISKLIVIPVKRTPFVKRENKIAISDGVITSNAITKPSSVEGFVEIPINIAKAVVGIPGQLIQFKFDNTKRSDELEKAKLNYEKSIQESQKFALTKEQEIQKIKLDIQKSTLTNEAEIQKLKLELQKSLLEAQKNQLEAQKALNLLKKELEDLKKK